MPNEPGSLARAMRLLGEAGINVDYAYASGIDRVPMVGVVIGVADAQTGVIRRWNLENLMINAFVRAHDGRVSRRVRRRRAHQVR